MRNKIIKYALTTLFGLFLTACSQFPTQNTTAVDAAASNHSTADSGSDKETQLAGSIWDRIRSGFVIPDEQNSRIDAELAWYLKHPEYLVRVAERADPFLYLIVEHLEEQQLPMELALLPIVESAFQPFAYSHGRAAGIWQFIPSTGRMYGLKQNWWYDGRRDIHASTEAAGKYFTRLSKYFDGNWLHSLAAYNAGERSVQRSIRRNKAKGKPIDFWALGLPKETRSYVPKLLALKHILLNADALGINFPNILNTQKVTVVDTGGQIDLALASELSELPLDVLYGLNPGYNRWATDPDGPHRLLLPLKNAKTFLSQLSNIPANERITWKRHKVKKGQTLGQIADKTGTTVAHLKAINGIRGTRIRAGKHLIVPKASRGSKAYSMSQKQRLLRLQNTERSGAKLKHMVLPGDTIWGLSRQYNVKPKTLARWNGLAVRDTIHPGQTLVIWQKSASAEKVSFSSHSLSQLQNKESIRRINYKVRRGDSLSRIASRFSVGVSDLVRWNPRLKKRKYLQPGQRVVIYADLRKQSG